MPVIADPPRKPRHRTPGTWTAEQAHAANLKSRIAKRVKAQQRKLAKLNKAPEPEPERGLDPQHALTHSLAVAAKRNQGKLAVNLATALAKLKSIPRQPSSNYTTSPCSPVRQPTPATPQSAQAVEPKHSIDGASFAQYTEPLVQGSKESLKSGPVGAGCGVGTGPGAGVGGVIASITHRPNSGPLLSEATVEQLEARLKELRGGAMLAGNKSNPSVNTGVSGGAQRVGLVGPVPSSGPGSIGIGPQEGMEKFLVGGTWVWGKRKK